MLQRATLGVTGRHVAPITRVSDDVHCMCASGLNPYPTRGVWRLEIYVRCHLPLRMLQRI